MNNLTDCLGIREGIIAFVGGGGKTTTIYTLARELSDQGKKVIVTTTTKMYIPRETEVQATV
ncbi:MAG: selenium cofactor biosynthesis protein YqeC, partial [Cellulosilyticaceae bacterium]